MFRLRIRTMYSASGNESKRRNVPTAASKHLLNILLIAIRAQCRSHDDCTISTAGKTTTTSELSEAEIADNLFIATQVGD